MFYLKQDVHSALDHSTTYIYTYIISKMSKIFNGFFFKSSTICKLNYLNLFPKCG